MMRFLIVGLLSLQPLSLYALNKSICGMVDSRVPSTDSAIGRLLAHPQGRDACTATLISDRCALTAGHCLAYSWMEFNVPASVKGKMTYAAKEDLYQRDKVFGREEVMPGFDWLVFSLKKNSITDLYPGQVQGFYQVEREIPSAFLVSVTGYGMHSSENLTYTQQRALGELLKFDSSKLLIEHRADTYGGNSGSAIIDSVSEKIIGIHTHGDCIDSDNFPKSSNMGTLIWQNTKLQQAIDLCLQASE